MGMEVSRWNGKRMMMRVVGGLSELQGLKGI